MNNFTFGLTLLIVGMGGTLLTLFVLTLLIRAVTVLFPVRPKATGVKTETTSSHD
jgi:Na+-transporting methylmalonyl-CoA/oxaloacetate decarboxylase gamma subunit